MDYKSIQWDKVYPIMKEWLKYGEDSFSDHYSELRTLEEEENDPKIKKNLEVLLDLMDFLARRIGY